jgi:predicted aspartyl protease
VGRDTASVLKRPINYNGIYIRVNIKDMKIQALVDTGATCSILHPKKYEELALKCKMPDKIDNSSTLKSADGKTNKLKEQFMYPYL